MGKVGDFFGKILMAFDYATGSKVVDQVSSARFVGMVFDKKLKARADEYNRLIAQQQGELIEYKRTLARSFLREVADETSETLQADHETNVQVIAIATALVIATIVFYKTFLK